MSEQVGFNVPVNTLWRRVFPVNHLHWYWHANWKNQEREHKQNNAT